MNYQNNGYDRRNQNERFGTNVVTEKFDPNIDWFAKAEKVILDESKKPQSKKISTNQLRNILSILIELKNNFEKEELNKELDSEQIKLIKYAKIKMVYQVARENNEDFYRATQLGERLDHIKTKKDFNEIVKYVEALVAYHKFHIK